MPAPTIDPTPMNVAWATVIRFFSSVADMLSPQLHGADAYLRPEARGQATRRAGEGVGPFGPSAALGTLTA
ncbi:hypothetical protein GCM10023152_25400 [Agromyces bauzanensis]|uniref:Uncharacterized protein n=1 Tax=Agromyces bauzanensis TaxID=1308924 RepID=A0A917PN54_9MICO|nr:hypothetical protein GCM10011372_23650 [Agromyces bauzanensis]